MLSKIKLSRRVWEAVGVSELRIGGSYILRFKRANWCWACEIDHFWQVHRIWKVLIRYPRLRLPSENAQGDSFGGLLAHPNRRRSTLHFDRECALILGPYRSEVAHENL